MGRHSGVLPGSSRVLLLVVECPYIIVIIPGFWEVPMWRRPFVTILILVIAMILTLPVWAQQKPVAPGSSLAKPFTQEQVSNMVRAGLGDESGAKLIEQRGIDFAPAEDFLQSLKAAGASEAFLKALRAAKQPEPASECEKAA